MTTLIDPIGSIHTSDPRADLIPGLRAYALMHDAILRDCGRLGPAIERVATRDDATALAAWFGRFEAVILHHHEREDDVVFPLLERRVASFDARELGAEHVELDRLMDELRAALGSLRSSSTSATAPTGPTRRHAVEVAGEFERVMRDHIEVEEQVVFRLVPEQLTSDEWAAAEREIEKGISVRVMTFTLPWVLDDAQPELAAHVVGELPFVFRLFNSLLWERSYRKLAAPVRGVES